jgi:uncharacterized protein
VIQSLKFLALFLIALVLVACIGLSPRSDPSRFFVLAPIAGPDSARYGAGQKGLRNLSVGLGPIQFPSYLDRQQVTTRAGPNRLEVSENDRWAEPLAENFGRVLSENLSALLETARVINYPWLQTQRPDYEIRIEVLQFETAREQEARLTAQWAVIDSKEKKAFRAEESRLAGRAESAATEASVAALSQVLGQLSREIAEAIQVIEAQRKIAG